METQPQPTGIVSVQLSKFDKQVGQYKHFLTLQVTREHLLTASVKNRFRVKVEEYYLYEFTLDGELCKIYSVSPAVFDHPEIQMT